MAGEFARWSAGLAGEDAARPGCRLIPSLTHWQVLPAGVCLACSLSLAVIMCEASGSMQCGGGILLSIGVSNVIAIMCGTAGSLWFYG